MTDRRYSEAEVAEIFRRAAESQQAAPRQLPAGDGMTLADLQDIGQEVGLPPDLVAQSAGALDRQGVPAARRFLGLPIGVSRTVELSRRLTDEEWDQLVVDLRDTFEARGRVRVDGTLREWTNGNLQALLEPTPTGQRLRLRTVNANARGFMLIGVGMIGIALAPLVVAALELGTGTALAGFAPFGLIGAAFFGLGALRLPRWSVTRARQMEGIATRLAALTAPALSSGEARE